MLDNQRLTMLKIQALTAEAYHILIDKGTEMPGSSHLQSVREHGTYCCRQCGIALFRSHHQNASSCGWPSFDDEIPNRIQRYPDGDGRRTEIVCAVRCTSCFELNRQQTIVNAIFKDNNCLAARAFLNQHLNQ